MTAQKCQAITQDGTPCNAYAVTGSDYCFHHDPALADERREARRKGGRARHGRHVGPIEPVEPIDLDTMADVTALLHRTINDTLHLENSIHRARAIGYLSGLYIKALEMSTLEQRVIELERVLKARAESKRSKQK
jgi:hypothetical protein